MLAYLQRKFALSHQGAVDLVKGCIACAITDISQMVPICVLYFFVVDLMGGGVPQEAVLRYVLAAGGCLVLIFVANWVKYNATYFATYKESGVRRISLAEKLRRIPLSFFGKKDLSDLTSTIMADCKLLETAFSHWVPELFGSMVSTLLMAFGLFAFSWQMALAALWVIPVSIFIAFLTIKIKDTFNARQMAAKMAAADGIQECLETLRDLRSCNAQDAYLVGLDEKFANVEKRALFTELAMAAFVVSAQLILKFGIPCAALVGAVLLATGETTPEVFFMFLLVASRLYDPLSIALQNLAAINASFVNIDRMNDILFHPVQEGSTELANQGFDVEFDHVGFAYGDGETVLRDVSFTAKQDQVTALIGPSGGGKTTASRLAARFWDATAGAVRVGGQDVSEVDPETLMSLYSIVFQDVTLFNNTVRENIRIGSKDATDEQIRAAAQQANCLDFIEALPQGWDTLIGENGCELSGGERQRISIARAFLKDAPIILLDEATASLDVQNETLIQQSLSRLVQGKTVLMIAHRMRTVAGADNIVVLEDGCVSECGTPQQLYAQGGTYRRMADLQMSTAAHSG